MKNSKSYGFHGEGFTEERMYTFLWNDKKYSYSDYLSGLPKETDNYQSYKTAYPKKDDFSKWDEPMKTRAAGILQAEANLTVDPTRGATNWGGGQPNYNYYLDKFGADNVISIKDSKGFIHNYFNLNTEKLTPIPKLETKPRPNGIHLWLFQMGQPIL